MTLLARITRSADILGGKPTIRGTHLAVEHILQLLAAGDSVDEILLAYRALEAYDIRACFRFALQYMADNETQGEADLATAQKRIEELQAELSRLRTAANDAAAATFELLDAVAKAKASLTLGLLQLGEYVDGAKWITATRAMRDALGELEDG